MGMSRVAATIFAAALLALPAGAGAEERILSFVSDVTVEESGALEVAETIRVQAEGEQIKHGIFRDFPIAARDGSEDQADGFRMLSAVRDGVAENWVAEPRGASVRIRMGSADASLPPGEHVYILHYRITGQLGRFRRYDEIYWNATGRWPFPIESAEARIRLPKPVRFGNRAFYTGAYGSTGTDARIVSEAPGLIVFRTTRRLEPEEGLTIAVAWPKGNIAAPKARSSAKD